MFNAEKSLISLAKANTFAIYDSITFQQMFIRTMSCRVVMACILDRTNIIGIVLDHKPNHLKLWSDSMKMFIVDLELPDRILNIELTKKHIIVAVNRKVYIYSMFDLRKITSVETPENSSLFAYHYNDLQLATPSAIIGKIDIKSFTNENHFVIQAHKSFVGCLVWSQQYLASTSIKGTVIRVWKALNGELVKEFKRGSDIVTIHDLCFDPNEKWLACSSSKGTIHIFSMEQTQASIWNLWTCGSTIKFYIPETKTKILFLKHSLMILCDYHLIVVYDIDWDKNKVYLKQEHLLQ